MVNVISLCSFHRLLQLTSEAVSPIERPLCTDPPSRVPANATLLTPANTEKNKSGRRRGSEGTQASTIMNISMLNMRERSPPFMSAEVSSHVHVASVLTADIPVV